MIDEPPFLAQAIEKGECAVKTRLGGTAAREREGEELTLGGSGRQHDAHVFCEILPAAHGVRTVRAYGEDDDGAEVRMPVNGVGRACEEHLRLEVVSLDGIDASLAKKFQKPFGCTVDGINVGGSAKDRIGIRCAEALLVAERRRSAFARCAEDGAKEQEEKERKKACAAPLPLVTFLTSFRTICIP